MLFRHCCSNVLAILQLFPLCLAAPLIIICTLVVLTIICCIMLTICLYSKIKKRVLPKVPEPVYYNDPFVSTIWVCSSQFSQIQSVPFFLFFLNVLSYITPLETRVVLTNLSQKPVINLVTLKNGEYYKKW